MRKKNPKYLSWLASLTSLYRLYVVLQTMQIIVHKFYKQRLCLETSNSFKIVDFNFKIIKEEIENDR